MINTTIGKYKIIRLIGEGGMAAVYEAEHEMLGTKVAIKVLNPILSANAQIKERFRNEAKVMASLEHSNITKVIDFDEQPQQLSIVMEFLNGEDLNERIKRKGPLSVNEIKEVFSQTLKAFQYAHDKGIVHRDIKPSNIFILPDGQVKILDFGIAKLFGQGNEMTQTGTQMGTPIYMSPEQVKADKTIDHRSDIYSIGVTMFFAINGKPPYDSATQSQFDIFNKIVYEPLHEFSVQSKFKELVLKACQKNREDRYQNCKDFFDKMVSPTTDKTENNDKTIIETTTAERTNAVTNTIKNQAQEPISEVKNSNFKPIKKTSNHSLLFHLMPGILLFIAVFIFQYIYRFREFFEYVWLICFFALFIGHAIFRNRYFKKNNALYKEQIKRILYIVPGILFIVVTNYLDVQYDMAEYAEYTYISKRSIFPMVYFHDNEVLSSFFSLTIILLIVGISLYFLRVHKERHS